MADRKHHPPTPYSELPDYHPNHPEFHQPPKPPSTLDLLLKTAQAAGVFSLADGRPWASLPSPSDRLLVPLRSPNFRHWLATAFHQQHDRFPLPHHLRAALQILEAEARLNRFPFPSSLRLAHAGPLHQPHELVLHLASPDAPLLEIHPHFWQTIPHDSSPCTFFRRSPNALPLPKPSPECSFSPHAPNLDPLAQLRRLLRPATDQDWRRLLAWLLAAAKPHPEYPILVLDGPPQSGKSTAARLLRSILDPALAPFAPFPASSSQLLQSACLNRILAFDQVSRVSPSFADSLARLASGSASLPRSEHGLHFTPEPLARPILLARSPHPKPLPDSLRHLALHVCLLPLDDSSRRTAADLDAAFSSLLPHLLASLASLLSATLAQLPHTQLDRLPRFPNSAHWLAAAAPALGLSPEQFLAALDPDPDDPDPPTLAPAKPATFPTSSLDEESPVFPAPASTPPAGLFTPPQPHTPSATAASARLIAGRSAPVETPVLTRSHRRPPAGTRPLTAGPASAADDRRPARRFGSPAAPLSRMVASVAMFAAFRVLFLALLLCAVASPVAVDYLLVGAEEIGEARRKAQQRPWARKALDSLLERAGEALLQPVELPERGGQWPHWYSCPRDGARLNTLSPTEHECPVCRSLYRGDPYDAVVLYGVHTRYSRRVRDLGLAYRLTDRPEFAARAKDILLGYAARYRNYPLHDRFGQPNVGGGRIMAQTLDESVWLIPVVWGYCLIRETLPDDHRRAIEQGLLRPAAETIRSHRMGVHNIQCWKNSAVGLVGFATGDRDLISEAIDDPQRGFRRQIAQGVTADGLWFEGSLGYHQYTMSALWPLAEAARRAGIDLYSDRYRSLYDAPIALALPNGDPPGFNDSAGANLRAYAPLYELAYARWRRPEHGRVAAHAARDSIEALLYGVPDLPQGPIVPERSSLLRHAGYAVLRSPQVTAAVRFGMHGGGHGHPDKLNLVTFGAGRLAGLDPGSINYGTPLHLEWFKTTIAHNTVSVDQRIQKNEDGSLELWSIEDGVTSFAAIAPTVYDGVHLRRKLQLAAAQLRDTFECSSDQLHTYDWAFHVPGRFSSPLTLERFQGRLGEANGYQHIRSLHHGKTGDDWRAAFELGGARLVLCFKGVPGTEVFVGEAPGRNPQDRVAVLIVRRNAARTVFDVTHTFEP